MNENGTSLGRDRGHLAAVPIVRPVSSPLDSPFELQAVQRKEPSEAIMQANAVMKRKPVAAWCANLAAHLVVVCLLVVISSLSAPDARAAFPAEPLWASCNDNNCLGNAPLACPNGAQQCFATRDEAFAAWPGTYPFFCGWAGAPFHYDRTYPGERWRRLWYQAENCSAPSTNHWWAIQQGASSLQCPLGSVPIAGGQCQCKVGFLQANNT